MGEYVVWRAGFPIKLVEASSLEACACEVRRVSGLEELVIVSREYWEDFKKMRIISRGKGGAQSNRGR